MDVETVAPERRTRRGSASAGLRLLVLCLGMGLVVGAAWYLLAPSGPVVAQPGYLFAVDDPELAAGQDGVFAALSAVAGLLVGAWVTLRSGGSPATRTAWAVLGGVLGAVLAWQLGGLLGPPAPPIGPDAGGGPAVEAPLRVHALGLLLTWPAVTAATVFVGQLWSLLRTARP